MIPDSAEKPSTREVMERAAQTRIVLLGEEHDRPEHHLWQLQVLAALQARRDRLVIGFEMFPRAAQPALDRWVAGDITENELLGETGWATNWGFPAELYLPLFRFARLNRLPMFGLNVDRSLVARVAEKGWQAVPASDREGLSDPAPASPEYRKHLERVLTLHPENGPASTPSAEALDRFIEAQLVWDRAFAEALHRAAEEQPDALVVGVIGSGHLERRYGVPHQLAALGIHDVSVLVPWTPSRDCAEIAAGFADAIFGTEPVGLQATPPQLGVMIGPAEGGVAVMDLRADGVGRAAGLERGDVILTAAGRPVESPAALKEIVERQAPGTWLPLQVRRGKQTLDLVARFPAEP